jgi:predicted DNA-binding transcriptional regulator AlpA
MAHTAKAPTPVSASSPTPTARPPRKPGWPRRELPPFTVPSEGEGLITAYQFRCALQIGKSTFYRWLSEGRFEPVRLSKNMIRFRIADVRKLLAHWACDHGTDAAKGGAR